MEYKDNENEALLIKNLSEGNILAFNSLFIKYSGRLFRFTKGYLKSESDTEDLVQEVFIIVWKTRFRLRQELSFKSYLFTIAFNLIKRHFRSKALALEYFENSNHEQLDLETSQKINNESTIQYIKKLTEKLPERQKEIFIRSRFDGQSIKEIASEMNISHKTVENQISTVLKSIRKSLERESLVKS